jgi:hypothetical protein
LLFRIDTTTGQGTVVGNVGTTLDLSAMAFDAAGNLFVVNSFTNTIHQVNKNTAAIIGTASLSGVNQELGGLAFRPGDGTLFFASGTTSQLDVVNPITGSVTAVGPVPVLGGIWALTFDAKGPTAVSPTGWGRLKEMYR